jgi:hypothetical protein
MDPAWATLATKRLTKGRGINAGARLVLEGYGAALHQHNRPRIRTLGYPEPNVRGAMQRLEKGNCLAVEAHGSTLGKR